MYGLIDSKLKGDIEKARILIYFHSILSNSMLQDLYP